LGTPIRFPAKNGFNGILPKGRRRGVGDGEVPRSKACSREGRGAAEPPYGARARALLGTPRIQEGGSAPLSTFRFAPLLTPPLEVALQRE